MSRKCTEAYESVFNYIDTHIVKIKNAASFTTDYELAMRKALRKFSPSSTLYACYFHYCQAVKKNAYQTDGFVKFIKSNENAKSVYYRLLCLPLLPSEYIDNCFIELKHEADEINKQGFRSFMKYFKNQWIKKVMFISLKVYNLLQISMFCRKVQIIFQ